MFRLLSDKTHQLLARRRGEFFFRIGRKSRCINAERIDRELDRGVPGWRAECDAILTPLPASLDGSAKAKAMNERAAAIVRLVEVCREVFGMTPLCDDGSGCTHEEVMAVFHQFRELFPETIRGD